jgi:hypothetical protein
LQHRFPSAEGVTHALDDDSTADDELRLQLGPGPRDAATEQTTNPTGHQADRPERFQFQLKAAFEAPLLSRQRSPHERLKMSESVGALAAPSAAQYALAVTRKEHDQQNQEGKQAVQLIEAATAPQLANSGAVGTKLNLVA